MYIEETEAEEILSKDKLIDSICDTINNFNSKDIGNENFNLGFRYAIYKVSNLFEERDKEIERLNNIINELEKEIDRLLERQYESERFAKEQGFDTYLPAKENLLCVKNKLQELKGSDKE